MRVLALVATCLTVAASSAVASVDLHPKHPRKIHHPKWSILDRDIHRAIDYSAQTWGVSAAWMRSCAATEGGFGRFVDNRPYLPSADPKDTVRGTRVDGDGWWQFLMDTWRRMSAGAWSEGYKLGPHKTPPTRYLKINSRLGQAWTVAWAFKRGSSHEWHGSGC